jgi:hypothetical protein
MMLSTKTVQKPKAKNSAITNPTIRAGPPLLLAFASAWSCLIISSVMRGSTKPHTTNAGRTAQAIAFERTVGEFTCTGNGGR